MRRRGIWVAALLLVGCVGTPRPAQPISIHPLGEGPIVHITEMYGDLRRHTQRVHPGNIVHMSVSADGKWFVFAAAEKGGTPQIYVQSADGVAPGRLTGNRYSNLHPRLSPDNKLVAFASDRNGNWDIFVTRVDAPTSLIQVTSDTTDEIAPAWAPDSKHLVFCSRRADGVWMIKYVDWTTGILTTLGPGMYPDWGKGDLIAFQTQPALHDARVGVQIVETNGRNLRLVQFDPAGKYSAVTPRWSPDGRWLVFAVLDGNAVEERLQGHSKDLWVVKHDGTNAMRLTGDELADDWWPSWGEGRIFFVSDRDQGYENVYSFQPKLIDPDERGTR